MVKKKTIARRKIAGQGSSSRPPKRHEATVEPLSPQIEAFLPLQVYNLNVVPFPLIEKPLDLN